VKEPQPKSEKVFNLAQARRMQALDKTWPVMSLTIYDNGVASLEHHPDITSREAIDSIMVAAAVVAGSLKPEADSG